MIALEALLDSSLFHCLGWTLLHFLWQGIAVGTVYAVIRPLLERKSPAARYHLAMCTLAVLCTLPIITFIHLVNAPPDISVNKALPAISNLVALNANRSATTAFSLIGSLRIWLQPLVPWVVPVWLLGIFVATLRVWRSWRHAYHLRETAVFVPLQDWDSVVQSLCSLFGIHKLVRLAVSAGISVPSVIGWLKPIILIPPSAIAGLTPLQMELILAHELAHIRRQDYLWNLLQVAAETLLFYHPVVRWVSYQARQEREQCCDDMVVGMHGNAVEYARALTELESLRHPRRALLLGVNGGQVLERIHRLLGLSAPDAPTLWLPLLLFVGSLFTISILQLTRQELSVHSILTSKFNMLGYIRQEHMPASIESVAPAVSPTRINVSSMIEPTALKLVHILSEPQKIALIDIPKLAQPITLAKAGTHTEIPSSDNTMPINLIAGSVIVEHPPVYPPLELEDGIEGSATVEFTLTAKGVITGMQVTRIIGSRRFGQAAMDALRQWEISPATIGGIPVAQHMAEEFIFRLKTPDTKSGTCKIPMGYHVCSSN